MMMMKGIKMSRDQRMLGIGSMIYQKSGWRRLQMKGRFFNEQSPKQFLRTSMWADKIRSSPTFYSLWPGQSQIFFSLAAPKLNGTAAHLQSLKAPINPNQNLLYTGSKDAGGWFSLKTEHQC